MSDFVKNFNAKTLEDRYAETLDKPAFARLVPYKGYESIVFGGTFATFLPINVAEVYDALCLQAASEAGFITRQGESLRKGLERARAEGRIPAHLPPVSPAEWRALFTVRQLTVKRMIKMLEGFCDWKKSRRTDAVVQLARVLAAAAPHAKSTEVQAAVPEARRVESATAKELAEMADEYGPVVKTGTEG